MVMNAESKAKKFADLHRQKDPLILANAWDAASARIFEKAGFQLLEQQVQVLLHPEAIVTAKISRKRK